MTQPVEVAEAVEALTAEDVAEVVAAEVSIAVDVAVDAEAGVVAEAQRTAVASGIFRARR